MGTHISRVKSVDLDSWTDEQLQSIMKWGNARANKYAEFGYTQAAIRICLFLAGLTVLA